MAGLGTPAIPGTSGGGSGGNVIVTGPLGSKVGAQSVSVVIASDQGTLPVSGSFSLTNPSTGSPVPATANYVAGNKGGNLTGLLIGSSTSANSLAVVIASDQASFGVAATLNAETTKVIGTVNVAVSQTIAVTQATASALNATVVGTGTFAVQATATQGTASLLNATVVGTGTFVVQATLAAETTKVIGVTRTADGSGNLITSTGNALDINIKSGNPTTMTVTQATGTNLHTVVDSGTITTVSAVTAISNALPAGTNLLGKVGIDQTTPGTTNAVVASIASGQTIAVTYGSGAFVVQGPIASGSSNGNNPVKIGYVAQTALPTAVSAGQVVDSNGDKFGRGVIIPFGQRDIVLPMTQLTLSGTTTETSLITAVASTFLDLISLVVINTSAAATQVDFRDSTGGTIRLSLYVPAGDTRGVVFSTPFPQAAVNTAWTAKCGTSVSSIIITGSYITNK